MQMIGNMSYGPKRLGFDSLRQLTVLFALFGVPAAAWSTQVSVAGFAFAGDSAGAAERFPYTQKIFQAQKVSGGANSFSRLVLDKAKDVKNSEFEFVPGGMVNLKNDQALMTALVLTGEIVSVENYGSYYKTFVNLRGDALLFDDKQKKIIRSCPLSVVLFDATADKPTEERIANFVNDLIRRDDGRGLVTQFTRCLDRLSPPRDGLKTVQVRKGEVSREALALMPEALQKKPETVNAMFADSLASILSAKLGISMLPTSLGDVGGVMAMRLENGDDINLKVPEGDYIFAVKLNKLAKIKTSENNISAGYIYAAYVSLRFYEPLLETTYIETDLKNGESTVIPSSQVNTDDFAGYQDAIRGLFLKFSDAIQKPDSKWIGVAASAKNIASQLESARTTLKGSK